MEKRKLLVGKDLLVLALLLLAAAGLCFLPRGASARAVLTVDGETAAVRELEKLEKDLGVRFDAEVDINGFGVKLKEILENKKTFLGKGLYDVKILDRENSMF